MRVIVREQIYRAGVGIWLVDDRDGKTYVAKPSQLVFEQKGSEGCWSLDEPWIQMSRAECQMFLQSLCNELSQLGYRPDTDRISGELDATKRHLTREQGILDKLLAMISRSPLDDHSR